MHYLIHLPINKPIIKAVVSWVLRGKSIITFQLIIIQQSERELGCFTSVGFQAFMTGDFWRHFQDKTKLLLEQSGVEQ